MNIALDFGPYLTLEPSIRLRLRLPRLSDEELFTVCQKNEAWRIEREPNGDLTVRPLLGDRTGLQVAALNEQLDRWARASGDGVALGSCRSMFLRNGALRCPSAACVCIERWQSLRLEEHDGFLPFCADFVAEVASPFEDRGEVIDRMLEYRENGARLAWLIDPAIRTVDVYRPREPVRTLTDLTHLTEPKDSAVLPGFVLDLRRVWNAGG